MTYPISSQVVVITGASSGVGRACAQAFGACGARIGLIARTEVALRNAAAEVEAAGGQALVLPLDVTDADAVEAAAAQVEQRWGRIDTWINNAMTTVLSPGQQMTMDEFRRISEVNYLGCVSGTFAALRRMVPRDRGTVIQIGSALAYRSIPLQSAYCASKAAQRAFSESLRTELLHDGSHVRISVLLLPAVNTPQFDHTRSCMPRRSQPVPPIYQPELIAQAALYAAQHEVREMAIGGGALKAIIGQRLAPGLLDHYLAKTGYDAQLSPEPRPAAQPENLYQPMVADPGAHGRFDSVARARSAQLWLRFHQRQAVATCLLAVAATVLGFARRRFT